MKSSDTFQKGALGVTLTQLHVERDLGWIFRRVDHGDVGIDAEVEVVVGGIATGQLLAFQIKAGDSYFKESTEEGWRYRGDYLHLDYWREHRLSVVVVLVDLYKEKAYWQHVGSNAQITESEKSWTIEVLRGNELSASNAKSTAKKWSDAAWAGNLLEALYRYCNLHQHFISIISDGGEIEIEVVEWINKLRGQADFEMVCIPIEGDEERYNIQLIGIERVSIKLLERLFPWCHAQIDEEYYEIHEEDDMDPEAIFHDADTNDYITFYGRNRTSLQGSGVDRPYSYTGEVESYRYKLSLNPVGKAFSVLKTASAEIKQYPPYYILKNLRKGL